MATSPDSNSHSNGSSSLGTKSLKTSLKSLKTSLKSTAVIHILGFRCFFFFAYKYLYTCLAGTPAQPYSHKG